MRRIPWIALMCIIMVWGFLSACNASSENPSAELHNSDLVGNWESRYEDGGIDRILIREDGTFKQTFNDSMKNYSWETPWNKWSLEKLPDGKVRLHLQGGRYYSSGIEVAERDGLGPPCPTEHPDCGWDHSPFLFYDPFEEQLIEMVNELILNIRKESTPGLILHQMWTSSDRGFAFFGGEQEIFRRVDTTN